MIAKAPFVPAGGPLAVAPATRANADSVGVVIVNFNSGGYLQKCLEALAQQTTRPHRVIVVDNASSDDSLAAAAAAYRGVEIIRSSENLGFAAANNRGIERLNDCRWIALVNPDAVPTRDWLTRLLKAARQTPQCGFFSSQLVTTDDPQTLDGTGDVYHVSGRAWRRDCGRPRAANAASHSPVLSACAAAALYRRDALMSVGCFDEDYFCYYEDVDLGFRLQLAGYAGRYVAEAIAGHAGSAVTARHSDFCVYHGHRNLVWTYVKDMPGALFWLYLPQHILLNVCTITWFTFRGRGRVIWRAKWDALRGLPAAWRKRRTIQARRKVTLRHIHSQMAHGVWRAFSGR